MLDALHACMPIYTKTGDKGTTALFNNSRVSKAHIRLQTYGDIDELNSLLGVVISELPKSYSQRVMLSQVQKDLFAIGAVLANPVAPIDTAFLETLTARTSEFEKEIDTMTGKLAELKNFILPGGAKAAALLQYARAVSRRVERSSVALHEKETVALEILQYLNRLSDYLFTCARLVNHTEGQEEVIWKG